MSKPKDVSASLYDAGNGEIKVWCVSFTIKGSCPSSFKNEAAYNKKIKQIEKLIETLEFPEE